MNKIILASQSPRRQQLLDLAGIPFEVVVKHGDEDYPPDMDVYRVPAFLANKKAVIVLESLQKKTGNNNHFLQNLPIVAADTVVILNGKIIEKPQTKDEAIEFLTLLSGQTHEVITGVSILFKGKTISFAEKTKVSFYKLKPEQITYYVDKFEPYDKAGAYAIQEWIGVVGIRKINGDFYNVMGLPISRLIQKLNKILS